MERKIVLASHGKFASGIYSSLQLICGDQENVSALDCYLTEDFDLTEAVKKIMKENQDNELIVVTDLFGGSVNNEFLHYMSQANFYLVAGMNLPFLIELTPMLSMDLPVEMSIQQALASAKQSIQFCNETIKNEVEEDEF